MRIQIHIGGCGIFSRPIPNAENSQTDGSLAVKLAIASHAEAYADSGIRVVGRHSTSVSAHGILLCVAEEGLFDLLEGVGLGKKRLQGDGFASIDCGRLRNGNGQIEILAVRQAGAGDTHDISMLIYQWSAVISTVEGATISYNFSADNFRFPPQAVKKTDSRIAAVSKTRFIAGASSRPKLRIPRQHGISFLFMATQTVRLVSGQPQIVKGF